MDTVIRISRPDDVVAYIPYALGFRPRDSAALVGMREDGRSLGLTTRVDLAGLAHPDAGPALVAEIADCLARDGCDDAFVVLYTDEPRDTLATDPVVRPALERLRTLTSWTDPPGPWVVGGGTYGCWGDEEECAAADASTAELEQGWLAATMVLHGKSLADARESLHVPLTAGPRRRRIALRAYRRSREALLAARAASLRRPAPRGASFGIAGPAPTDPLDEWRDARWGTWRRLVAGVRAGEELAPAALGTLAAAMDDPRLRDGVLYSLAHPMPPTVPTALMAISALDEVMGHGGLPPRPELVDPVETVLRAAAACLGAGPGAHPLAALAWIAWWSGDGARADVLSQQVLRARPGTRLAELVHQALSAHVPPGWVSRSAVDRVEPRSIR